MRSYPVRAALGIWLVLGCGFSCGGDVDDPALDGELMVALDGHMTAERRDAFKAEFALATERFDYSTLDPAEVVEGRKLEHTRLDGQYFVRYIIDGQEHDKHTHEALRSPRRMGRAFRIPYYYDPQHRFVVVRQMFKIEQKWEVIAEYWLIMPADSKKRSLLESTLSASEVSSAEDMLGNTSAGRRVTARPPGFKTRVTRGKNRRAIKKPAGIQKRRGSGLSVVPRRGMTARTVKDVNGKRVKIWGQSRSPSKTPGHDAAMETRALQMARSGKYEYVTIQRSWRTATGRVSKSRKIPDIIGVRRDGMVDAIEIRSKTDSEEILRQRLEHGMQTVPRERRGDVYVFDP